MRWTVVTERHGGGTKVEHKYTHTVQIRTHTRKQHLTIESARVLMKNV